MTWNLQSYTATVLSKRMWHFRGQNILWPLLHNFNGVRTPATPQDLRPCTYQATDWARRRPTSARNWRVNHSIAADKLATIASSNDQSIAAGFQTATAATAAAGVERLRQSVSPTVLMSWRLEATHRDDIFNSSTIMLAYKAINTGDNLLLLHTAK